MGIIILASVLIGYSDLNEPDKYFIKNDDADDCWIENRSGKKVVTLEKYNLYNYNGRKLKLVSKLGFSLENIPLDNERFYNECIEIFLEAEKELPKAYECLKNNGQNARAINTLKFFFPEEPVIDKKGGYTKFWEGNVVTCTKDGKMVRGSMWVVGLYKKEVDLITVTLTQNHYHYICVHEYIHACGYGHVCDKDKSEEKKNFRCAEK